MDELKKQLKETLATVFSFYLKAANFHWNVEGPDFYSYHKMFGEIYDDVHESIDALAEHIRTIGTYTPASYKRFAELTKIDDALEPFAADDMLKKLHSDNEVVLAMLHKSLAEAQKHNLQGLMNFLADRIDQHNKWGWFLRSSMKGTQQ